MALNLRGRDFLTLRDFTPEEIVGLLDLAADYKKKKKRGKRVDTFKGKNIALIFEKTSTRTRCSFEVAAHDLGIGTTYLAEGSQIGKKESIADTARVLGRMFDGIEYRGFEQSIVETLAKHADVPVWNGLTNEYHPTQMLADALQRRKLPLRRMLKAWTKPYALRAKKIFSVGAACAGLRAVGKRKRRLHHA